MAKERLSMRKIKEAYNSTSIINDPPDKLWEWGTLVLKKLAASLALQNAKSFHCKLSRNQRPLTSRNPALAIFTPGCAGEAYG